MSAVEGRLLLPWLLRLRHRAESIRDAIAAGPLERVASAPMTALPQRLCRWLGAPLAIVAGAVLLRLVAGVAFANYDTLYALAWGGQLSRGVTPSYDVPIAPTPHPLVELLGLVLGPLGPRASEDVTVALAFLALSGCGWLIYRLGAEWFGWAAGAVAAVIFLTRVPVLSYGVRAYVDVPYLLFVLGALLIESRSRSQRDRPAGAPVLVLLALAGLLRPEAWAFSALYWAYLMGLVPAALRPPSRPDRRAALRLGAIAAAAPLVWVLSDLLVTGDPLWSLTHTRSTASILDRTTGIANVPEYIPRRIGEILRPAGLLAAALGGVLSLLWLRRRAALAAIVGVIAVVVFAAFATLGLPINSRYAFLASALLSIFAGAGVFGWMRLQPGDPGRRAWIGLGALVLVVLVASMPGQVRSAHRQLDALARQQSIEGDLLALVRNHTINLRCGPVGVPNHAPIPLLALYLKTSPRNIVSLQVGHIASGVYVDPATREVEKDYVLDPNDPVRPAAVPPGFSAVGANRSWLIFHRCD